MSSDIEKEKSELYDALSRELGEAMSPYEELVLLGIYDADIEPFERIAEDYDEYPDYDEGFEISYGESDEEYDYDENDERYSMFTDVIKLNNDRKKHFA